MLEKMRAMRKKKGLSMKQLGEMVGVAEATISTYENGRSEPSLTVLCAIADILDCSLDMLVRGKEKDRPVERSVKDVADAITSLSVEDQDVLISIARALRARR